jgi:four helix bundle protein
MNDYKQLVVWQRAMNLGVLTYEVTRKFPREEVYCLTSQLRRAALSVPSNIAEGHGRTSTASQLRFLDDARGSLFEVETQLLFAERVRILPSDDAVILLAEVRRVMQLLNGLIRALRRRRDGAG